MIEFYIPGFIGRALLAGAGIASVAGPLGSFVVWRRISYLGDTLSHASLLGIALALLFNLHPHFGIFTVILCIAIIMVLLQNQRLLASDAILGMLAHGSLAIGLLVVSSLKTIRVNVLNYLYGDILAVTWSDIAVIYCGGILVILGLISIWRPLLSISVDEDLAYVEGVPVFKIKIIFSILLAMVIAIAIKLVGALLITALLIIPVLTVRLLSGSPERMAVNASFVGILAVLTSIFQLFARMYALTLERQGEWGLYIALGSTWADIAKMILAEVGFLAVGGAVTGFLFGYILFVWSIGFMEAQQAFPFLYPKLGTTFEIAFFIFVVLLFISSIAAVIPAYRSRSIQPSEIMTRGEFY